MGVGVRVGIGSGRPIRPPPGLAADHVLLRENESEMNDYLSEERRILSPSDFSPKRVSFQEWVNSTSSSSGHFFDHSKLAEGEVLLFRTKKNKYRAIPVMRSSPSGISSKFSDALTFKEWLRKTSPEEKAIRISVKTTDVVRPVLQHLYAAKEDFTAPVIVHANTFPSRHSSEKPVDPIIFIETTQKLLPEATISLGWTPSSDYAVLNRLDWSRAFKLMSYISNLHQPVMLTMDLNDALHSLDQLEWLLGISDPEVFVLVKADSTSFMDSEEFLSKMSMIPEGDKILFDVDDSWKRKLRYLPESSKKKKKRSVISEKWTNLVFPNSHSMLSTSVVSKSGIAFLGWPNALLLSDSEQTAYPSKQVITGKVMFLPKRQLRHVKPERDSGIIFQFFDKDKMSIDSSEVDDSIKVLIGYDGQISIENKLRKMDPIYHSSSSGKLPKSSCYDFRILDKGWRIDTEVSTTPCKGLKDPVKIRKPSNLESKELEEENFTVYSTFLTLDTPVSKTRKLRSVAIGKSGDGAIDFLLQELEHSSSITVSISLLLLLPLFRLL
ncbi:hypothetical protein FO519_007155 [Halicephalobus sp. NKZ332]|nr:hypothetical protein FO519_007155 [Halicephalobus sp. NKZ332]